MRVVWHWLTYLAFFTGMCFFASEYHGWFSYYLLTLTVLFPVFSLLFFLPSYCNTVFSVSAPKSVCRGDTGAAVWISVKNRIPLWSFPVTVSVYQEFLSEKNKRRKKLNHAVTGTKAGRLIEIPLDTAHTGLVRTVFIGAVMQDALGLFRFPIPLGRRTIQTALTADTVVLPCPLRPEQVPVVHPARGKLSSSNTFSEIHETRPYRPGDSMRSVHWKLSAKTDDLLVREPMAYDRVRAVLLFDRPTEKNASDRQLDRLCWTIRALLFADTEEEAVLRTASPVLLGYADANGDAVFFRYDTEAAEAAFFSALLSEGILSDDGKDGVLSAAPCLGQAVLGGADVYLLAADGTFGQLLSGR